MKESIILSKKLIVFTICYNLLEGVFALYFGVESNSTTLLSFGLDSFIEIFASIIAIWGISSTNKKVHDRAEKLIAYSFLVLIVFILTKSALDFLIQINLKFLFME